MTFRVCALGLALGLAGCGSPSAPELPLRPELLSPTAGAQATSDRPTFTVRNARGFDIGQATYVFHIFNERGSRQILELRADAGSGTTSATPAEGLPRSVTLQWNVTASGAAGDTSSDTTTFRTVPVVCLSGRDPYAKSVVSWYVPPACLARNLYNDPNAVLGPPDLSGYGPDHYHGFMSLGDKGYVIVDMEACAVDQPGDDIRVFQSVSGEPVSLYASGTPDGPFLLLEYRKYCGNPSGPGIASNHCDFDLSKADLKEARYFKIEDGEQFPCEQGTTVTEGADIDAIQILHEKP